MQNSKSEWKQVAKRVYGRTMWVNYDKACRIVDSLGLRYRNLNVLDCYPGASVFSAALQNTIKPKKHMFFEPIKTFNKFLTMQGQTASSLDPFRWDTFEAERANYEIETQPYSQVHDQCLFMANLTHAQGEQLVAQYLNCMYNRSWIFKHGRVRMLLWVKPETAERFLAGPGEKFRNRVGAQREAIADARAIVHARPERRLYSQKRTMPYPELCQNPEFTLEADDYSGRTPISLVEFVPKQEQLEHLDEFEYVLRNLFMARSLTLRAGLNSLGHGAEEALAPKLADILDKQVYDLNVEDFKRTTQAFWEWPFKPEFLHDFYDDGEIETDPHI